MAAVYDRIARYYDRVFAPLERFGLRQLRARVASLIPHDAAILEIGCGAGANFEFYPDSRLAVSSELSIGMLDVARTKKRDNHLIQVDAQSLPFPDSEFDAAFATLVFCSIPKPEKAFAEVSRVVKRGGRVVLLEHVRPDNLLGPAFDIMSRLTVATFDDHFDRRTTQTAARSGLRIVSVEKKLAGIVNLIVGEVIK